MSIASAIGQFLDQVVFLSNGLPAVVLDCSISETHKRESLITEFEVENGQTISDHIAVKPFSLHIQGLISDSPISALGTIAKAAAISVATAKAPNPGVIGNQAAAIAALPLIPNLFNPSADAYVQMLAFQVAKFPITVITTLHIYNNMWVKSISVPRDSKSGAGLIFDIELVQLLLVFPVTVNIAQFAAADVAAGIAHKGVQSANPLGADFANGSGLASDIVSAPP